MTIYNIFDYAETSSEFEEQSPFSQEKVKKHQNYIQDPSSKKDLILSAFFARMFFLCLLVRRCFLGSLFFGSLWFKTLFKPFNPLSNKKTPQGLKKDPSSHQNALWFVL